MTLAYNSDPTLKIAMLEIVAAHEAADEIVQGTYFDETGPKLRACAVGCTLHSYAVATKTAGFEYSQHAIYDEILGKGGRTLAHLEDRIFEGLPVDACATWPRRFLEAIRPGADLSLVWAKFAFWLLTEEVALNATKDRRVKESVDNVAALYLRVIAGETVRNDEWAAAAYAASSAAYAAYAADYAAHSADYAASSAAAAASSASVAASAAYVAYAAAAASFARMADKLVSILMEF